MLRALRAGPLAAGALAFPAAPRLMQPPVGARGGAPDAPSAIPPAPALRGRVASVHRRAANLLLETGALVTLLPEGVPIHPWAVSMPFDPAALREGEAVWIEGPVLCAGAVRVSLEAAEVAGLRLSARPAALAPGTAAWLQRRAEGAGAGAPPGPFDAALSAALARFRAGGPAAELATLVGLGEGLTPSGDDALVGVLAGLDLAREAAPAARALRAELAEALAAAAPRTARLSAQMLAAAVDGLYAEPVLGLLAALADAGPAAGSVEEAAAALAGMGHRSGTDTLWGIAAALTRAAAGG
ncbi:MAG TPA: DUF2877 domain-containing protein [Candidatus Saccharimonadales bacterium]|nr:DUF2877 domain-containing protein [Candidatus Saccharimonadales bacterium]